MAAVTSALSVSLALTAVAQSSVVPPAVGLARFLAHATHDVEEARIHVAVSGGSLPSILATALGSMSDAERAYCGVERWHVWLVDERMVAAHDAASNFKACMDTFMKRELGLNPDNIHPVPTHLTPEQAARAYEEEVVAHTSRSGAAADAAMHITLLGMGEDGHTASLFPGHALLEEGEALIGVELASPKPPPQRVTFTLPFIARSRAVAVVATGAGKAEALWRVVNDAAAPPLPIARVRDAAGNPPKFIVDEAAIARVKTDMRVSVPAS